MHMLRAARYCVRRDAEDRRARRQTFELREESLVVPAFYGQVEDDEVGRVGERRAQIEWRAGKGDLRAGQARLLAEPSNEEEVLDYGNRPNRPAPHCRASTCSTRPGASAWRGLSCGRRR